MTQPAVTTSLVLAVAAAGLGTSGMEGAAEAETGTFTVNPGEVQAAGSEAETLAADETRMSADRSGVVTQASLRQGQVAAATRARVAAVVKTRRQAAERATRARERAALVANAKSDPRAAARVLAAEQGWSGRQFSCLLTLWEGESNWRWWVANPSSGAYGIPQSLPGSKMASIASDWRTNPVTQIKWGLGYIESAYGTPCNALGKWQSRSPHWY